MGSEQSSHAPRRQTSLPPKRSDSPGVSQCSDSDLPYISYTVNRPIGSDSPKPGTSQQQRPVVASTRQNNRGGLLTSGLRRRTQNAKDIVVVKAAPASRCSAEIDVDMQQLNSIPMFLPIMRATVNSPAARDPEVLERLQPAPLLQLCSRLQEHMLSCANSVATEQNQITQQVRELDTKLSKCTSHLVEHQKRFARYADRLRQVHQLSHQLSKCHMLLNQSLDSVYTLNEMLEPSQRLEPFAWTTG